MIQRSLAFHIRKADFNKMQLTAEALTKHLELADALFAGRDRMVEPQDLPGRYWARGAGTGPSAGGVRLRSGGRRRLGGVAARVRRARNAGRGHRAATSKRGGVSAHSFSQRLRPDAAAGRTLAETSTSRNRYRSRYFARRRPARHRAHDRRRRRSRIPKRWAQCAAI